MIILFRVYKPLDRYTHAMRAIRNKIFFETLYRPNSHSNVLSLANFAR
jgi:hypothetical protein